MNTTIEPRRAAWRKLSLGSTVWAPFDAPGWPPGIIIGLGKNRGDKLVVHRRFETGGKGGRVAGEIYWRKPELKGKDKPKIHAVHSGNIFDAARQRAGDPDRPDTGRTFIATSDPD
jgi:hypothetical protein